MENDQIATQTIEVPQPLTPEDFRTHMIEAVRENPDLTERDNLSDDEAYDMGVASFFDAISHACVNSDIEELESLFEYYGFYNEDEISAISVLETSEQAEMVPTIMRSRISDIDDIAPALNFYDTYLRLEHAENVLQLNQSLHKLEAFSSTLPDDIKGQMYFNASLRYQEFTANNKLDYQYAKGQELNMLKKALFYTANPEIIAACEQRLDPNSKDASLVKIAYKNALNKTDDVDDLYQIHLSLGRIYFEESKVPGYKYPQSAASKSLAKAINHYQQASEMTDKEEDQLTALRSLATAQKISGDVDDWAATKYKIANLINNPHDKYNYLIGTAEELGNKSYRNSAKSMLNATIKAIKKDQNLNKMDKNRLLLNAYTSLNKNTEDATKKAETNKKIMRLEKKKFERLM